jgi:alanine racemase
MRIGVAGIGYGDGYPRNAKSGTPILVNDTPTQLIGRVAMDMIGIDLRPAPNTKIGAPITLWGKNLPIEKVSLYTKEFQYELLCGLTHRVQYQFYQD